MKAINSIFIFWFLLPRQPWRVRTLVVTMETCLGTYSAWCVFQNKVFMSVIENRSGFSLQGNKMWCLHTLSWCSQGYTLSLCFHLLRSNVPYSVNFTEARRITKEIGVLCLHMWVGAWDQTLPFAHRTGALQLSPIPGPNYTVLFI